MKPTVAKTYTHAQKEINNSNKTNIFMKPTVAKTYNHAQKEINNSNKTTMYINSELMPTLVPS